MATRKKAFTLVELLVVVSIIGLLTALLLPAVVAARQAARKTQCLNNLRQIGIAIANYDSKKNGLPPGLAPRPGNPTETWAWTVWLLPYLDQNGLFENLLRTGVADPSNRPHISTYFCPANERNDTEPQLSYAANMGRPDTAHGDSPANGLFHHWGRRKFQWSFDRLAAADGTSHTLMVTEKLVPEGNPDNLSWVGATEFQTGVLWDSNAGKLVFDGSNPAYPSSAHPGGYDQTSTAYHILFADGHVTFNTKPITAVTNIAPRISVIPDYVGVYRSILTPNGRSAFGEPQTKTPLVALNAQRPTSRQQARAHCEGSHEHRPGSVDSHVAATSCYKPGPAPARLTPAQRFVDTGYKWPQPEGTGSAVRITYSYSNLLNGNLRGLSAAQLKQATEEALGRWAAVAPLHFVEVVDSGPSAADNNYAGQGGPQIRIGAHRIDGAAGPVLAHAFLPVSPAAGLSGDVHMDVDEGWGAAQGGFFLEVMLHELGHALGLGHEDVLDAIMNPTIRFRFNGLGTSFLLTDDINGIRAIYGTGVGSVTPLNDPDPGPTPDPEPERNNVTVVYDSGANTVTIAGNGADNSIGLVSTRSSLIIYGLNGTTVNGNKLVTVSVSREGHAVCEMGGGNDVVVGFRLRLSSLGCELGAGDDVLAIFRSRMRNLTASGGAHEDRFLNLVNRIGNLVESGFEQTF